MIIATTKRIGYDNFYYLIIPDHASGRRNRYTLYRIPSHPTANDRQSIKILGRELPLDRCKRIANGQILFGELMK